MNFIFYSLSALSLILFLGSLLALPWFVGKLPEDYFVNSGKPSSGPIIIWIFRNLLGAVVFIAGGVMLFIPGQGLLTMVAGLVLMDFPGKARFIRELAKAPKVQDSLNWLRKKADTRP